MLDCLDFARRICPPYADGRGPTPHSEFETLVRYNRMRVTTRELDLPTLLLPPVAGDYRLLVDPGVHWRTRDLYLIRHELGHILAGDAGEPSTFHFEYPLPEAEMVADLFAFADLISGADLEQGVEWVGEKIRDMVVLESEHWYLRVPRVAAALSHLHEAGRLFR